MRWQIEIKNVYKTYKTARQQIPALKNINLTVSPGEFVAIMGPSGCGKSTLLQAVAGFINVDSGAVVVDGVPIQEQTETQRALFRRCHIGFVFQFFNLIENLTVIENISLPLLLQGEPWQTTRARCLDLLQELGLVDKAERLPNLLSGGQQQRVAIARALIHSPAVLLADEPTGNLDSETNREVLELLQRVNQRGQTILLVTHNPEVACVANRIIFMRDGLLADESCEPLTPWLFWWTEIGLRPGEFKSVISWQ